MPEASIKDQCYRRKFYGETDELEDALMGIESAIGPIIKNVIDGASVPRRSDLHAALLNFVALQILRTRAAAERLSRGMSLPMTYISRKSLELAGMDSDNIRVTLNSGIAYSLSLLTEYTDTLADLDIRVIRSLCGARLIASDSPVVLYNQWCEGVKDVGVMGATCSGIQIFFPLNPYCALMLFDEAVYDVEDHNTKQVTIYRPQDIYALNRLQTVFAQDNVYFSDWSDRDRILNALPKVAVLRQDHVQKMHVATSETKEEVAELLHIYTQMPDLHLKLKFSKVRQRASKVSLTDRVNSFRDTLPIPPNSVLSKISSYEQTPENRHRYYALKSTKTYPKDWGNLVP